MIKVLFIFSLFFICRVLAAEVEFQSGDIIFQTSKSSQSYAIMWASKSPYSHVGIIEVDGKKKYVLEAISKVSRTPLDKWIQRGRSSWYSVFRYQNIDSFKQQEIVSQAKSFLGLGYDIYFTSKNKEIYCSELVYLAFEKAGLPIEKWQKVKELDVDNVIVKKLIQKRWRNHPLCKSGVQKFDDCWRRILEDDLVTPQSVKEDTHLSLIWSNYPM